MPIDYVKARKCAFIEDQNMIFGSNLILLMIYANGQGVKSNPILASKLACQYVEMNEENFSSLAKRPPLTHIIADIQDQSSIDICDYVHLDRSVNLEESCLSKNAEIAQVERDREFTQLTIKWTEQQKQAFKQLRKTSSDYIKITSEQERHSMVLEALQSALMDHENQEKKLKDSIQNFEKGEMPNYSEKDYKKSDFELNKNYKQLLEKISLAEKEDNAILFFTDGIKIVERNWLKYRDAWIKFGMTRYPTVSLFSWKTWLTKERINELAELKQSIY